MCLNRVHTVDDDREIAALVEHTEVEPEQRRIEHTSAHCALIGRNDHQLIAGERNFGKRLDQCLDHLIGRADVVKAAERNGVLNLGVVRIKSDDVGHAHIGQLLERQCTVERFACGAVVLSALIEHRHDDRDSSRLAADGADDALEILIVVVRAHRDSHAVHLVGHAVVEHVADDIHVSAAHGLVNQPLCLARTETGAVCLCDVGLILHMTAPVLDVVVYLCGKRLASAHTDNTEFSVKRIVHKSSSNCYLVFCIV